MIDPAEIQFILREFNLNSYADLSANYVDNGKGGKILTHIKGSWKYEDEFYGGDPYSGNETLWFMDAGIFRCVYWGKVVEGINFSDIFDFLRQALKQGPTGVCVHRGPENYSRGKLNYINACKGTIEEFIQTEKIYLDGQEVYIAYFIGGRINVRN